MILGQSELPSRNPAWVDAAINVLSPIPSFLADTAYKLTHPSAPAAGVEVSEPEVPTVEEPAGTERSVTSRIRNAVASAVSPDYDAGYEQAASPWPWLIGLGALAAIGGYIVLRSKR